MVLVRTCSIDGCEMKHHAKGLCHKHYQNTIERITYAKGNRAKPENLAKDKLRRSTDEHKAKERKYKQTPEYKAKEKIRNQQPKRKKANLDRMRKVYQENPEIRAEFKKNRDTNRLKVLLAYSKRHSNSNIPCCRCCGKNSHIDFLAIDHIAGIQHMDSEPELVKLGFKAKITSTALIVWLIQNDFPKGFQILCHSCNYAKGMKKNNNKCPMENKPH
jgi:hypothetical protein